MITRGKIVPHVEAGHRGPISLSDIDSILHVSVEREAVDEVVETLQRARDGGRSDL